MLLDPNRLSQNAYDIADFNTCVGLMLLIRLIATLHPSFARLIDFGDFWFN